MLSAAPLDWHAATLALSEILGRPTFVVDADGIVRMASARMRELLGPRAELVGTPCQELVAAEGRRAARALLRGRGGAAAHRGRLVLRTCSGGSILADVSVHPVTGGVLCVVESSRVAPVIPTSAGCSYEVSTHGADRGRILRPVSDAGKRCYELFAGRDEMCVTCPIPERSGSQATGLTVLDDGGLMIVRARRATVGVAEVHHETLPAAAVRHLAREQLGVLAGRHGLSDRERQVLDHLVRGHTVQQIGAALAITPRTAKFHQANVLAKLGIDSRQELVRLLFHDEAA